MSRPDTFCKEYSGIKILKASEYLAIFEKKER
jgi:hypothetical protein